jgi:hypothetical protein
VLLERVPDAARRDVVIIEEVKATNWAIGGKFPMFKAGQPASSKGARARPLRHPSNREQRA